MARPKKRTKKIDNLDLITLDDAVEMIREFFKLENPPICRRTLQNKIYKGELHRYGPYKVPMLDRNEVLNKLCRLKAS